MNAEKYRTDTVVKTEGMMALLEKLGMVDTERFISLVISEPFDYTEWRETLFNGVDIETLANEANKYSTELK